MSQRDSAVSPDGPALRTAAQQVVDECSPTMPPSLGAIAKLRAALEAVPDPMAEFDRAEFDTLLREVVALREWKAAQEAVLHGEAVPQPQSALRDLLQEWLDTPFFETQESWQRWVDDFRPRVEAALR